MIAIINDGSNPSASGVHGYRVQINDKVICGFSHVREEGLEVCLLKAAEAVRRAQAQAHWAGDVNDPRHPDHHKTRVVSNEGVSGGWYCGGCGATDRNNQCMGCNHK